MEEGIYKVIWPKEICSFADKIKEYYVGDNHLFYIGENFLEIKENGNLRIGKPTNNWEYLFDCLLNEDCYLSLHKDKDSSYVMWNRKIGETFHRDHYRVCLDLEKPLFDVKLKDIDKSKFGIKLKKVGSLEEIII